MSEKWAVVFEYDLKEGLCVMARKDAGAGEIALFDTKEEAEELKKKLEAAGAKVELQ